MCDVPLEMPRVVQMGRRIRHRLLRGSANDLDLFRRDTVSVSKIANGFRGLNDGYLSNKVTDWVGT